jgi:hypothetical protein
MSRSLCTTRRARCVERCLSLEVKQKNICSHGVFRILARLRHADLVERCLLAGVHRRTFAQAEFFSV